jgi:hypothetical protein
MRSIAPYWLSIKNCIEGFLEGWGGATILVLLALSAFALGRLSILEEVREPVSFSRAPFLASPRALAPGGLIVASRSGTAYYYPWCAGAEKIQEANKRWFQNEEEARRAGFRPAKNCKGLE